MDTVWYANIELPSFHCYSLTDPKGMACWAGVGMLRSWQQENVCTNTWCLYQKLWSLILGVWKLCIQIPFVQNKQVLA